MIDKTYMKEKKSLSRDSICKNIKKNNFGIHISTHWRTKITLDLFDTVTYLTLIY